MSMVYWKVWLSPRSVPTLLCSSPSVRENLRNRWGSRSGAMPTPRRPRIPQRGRPATHAHPLGERCGQRLRVEPEIEVDVSSAGRSPSSGGFLLHPRPDSELRIRFADHPGFVLSIVVPQGWIGGGRAWSDLVERTARSWTRNVTMDHAQFGQRVQRSHFQVQRRGAAGKP